LTLRAVVSFAGHGRRHRCRARQRGRIRRVMRPAAADRKPMLIVVSELPR